MALATRGPPPMATNAPPPSQTLFVYNLPTQKIKTRDIKKNLYMLFTTYGVVLDINTTNSGGSMRGRAHVVMRDIETSTQAMRQLQGFSFYGKQIKITYAKSKSNTIAKLAGTFGQELEKPENESSATAPASAPTATSNLAAAVFGSAAPAKAKPVQEEKGKGVKRPREEEEEEEEEDEDEEAAMDVSDSD
ncbi:hypothetical protein EJ04DRAFT_213040 [Polyplosphaeria fusca]|uniref:RRM domain-containing protein n=1 Tax=Polyplosphaeria fusca TaxID=682080 RepID=A0A9P4RCG8_9PLEO|nr:hypothetical protein EJ04DRAFT_213040 [Polyplosphaeria fusca]